MPDQDPYADAAPADQPDAPTGPPDKETEPEQEEKGDQQTAEIPKGALGPELKPGEQVTMEVVQVNEDSYLLKKSEAKEAPPEEAPPEAPPPQGGPMTSLMQ